MSLAEAAPLSRGTDRQSHNNLSVSDLGDSSSTPRSSAMMNEAVPVDDPSKKDNKKKRGLFGFGKKKTDTIAVASDAAKTTTAASNRGSPALSRDTSKLSSTTSPKQSNYPYALPSSPGRGLSGSSRVASPAGSQIFERDVQDSTAVKPNSPAIPTHIQTENYIPPVLDDASEAITNHKLDPDTVEIVTHNAHQPASLAVTGGVNPSSTPYDQTSSEWAAELASFADKDKFVGDNISNYGSLDSADVRRLSFISFADVVQSEHPSHGVVSSRDSIHLAGLTSLPSASMNRSPSPIRSPVSSQGPETSPPTSNPASMKGLEMSPKRKPIGSPKSGQTLNMNGDLNIETMSQALRRTGSTELGNFRSIPTSPIEASSLR